MDQRARNYIAKVAEFVQKEFEISAPIENMETLISQLGGRMITVEDSLVSSVVERLTGEEAAFSITVSMAQPKARQRFAIARELGHLFLHMGYCSDWELWERYDAHMAQENFTEKEFQANEFAANLLMPQKEYMRFVAENAKNHRIDAYDIAHYFGVSESMAEIRGKLIGALKWA